MPNIVSIKRQENDKDHERSLKTELLIHMDGINNDKNNVLTLAPTNRPWDLDDAFLRRFSKRIHIPLPDLKARQQMFKMN